MRVLHVMEALEGGTARHLRDLARHTPDAEVHVAVPAERVGALTDVDAIPDMRAAGATVHVVPMTRRPPSAANARALPHLVGLVRRVGADVVHTHSSIGGVLGRVAARTTGRPAVHTPNGLYENRATLAVERTLAPLTARFLAVSDSEAATARRLRLARSERIVVVPNGIDPDPPAAAVDLRALAGVPAEAPLVLFVGRLIDQKRPADVARVLRRVLDARPGVWALMVGDGPLRAEVDAAAAGETRLRRLDGVRDVSAGFAGADLLLLLSAFEGAPYVPLEALRVGTPVVVSDVVGCREAVALTGGGRVVADDEDAVRAVVDLLDAPAERARLGTAGARAVRERLTAAHMAAQVRAVYDAVVAER